MDRSDAAHIARCKKLIEEKFQFGNEQGEVRQRDLEYLAEAIEERSGIRLSLSTLKRVWKKEYNQVPHPSTLQALVSVLGYKDWQAFKLEATVTANIPAGEVSPEQPTHIHPPKQKRFNPWLLIPILASIAVAVWLIAFRAKPAVDKPIVKGPVTFTGNKTVSQGVPNTVIFKYDVSKVAADSFFFQQSWNDREKVQLDPANHVYSAIYYYPGFHRAKLIANDSIIKRFRVHITTDGWLPLVRDPNNDHMPTYLHEAKAIHDGALHITQQDLTAAGIKMNKGAALSYFNIREFGNTKSDNFSLDTRIRCDSAQNLTCPGINVSIITEEHIFFVRLISKGCERDIAVKMGEAYHDGATHDLSPFGRNLFQWQHLQIKVVNKKATIYLDEQPVYTLTYTRDFGKIVGLVYHFTGAGAVDYVHLKNAQDSVVYKEEFDQ